MNSTSRTREATNGCVSDSPIQAFLRLLKAAPYAHMQNSPETATQKRAVSDTQPGLAHPALIAALAPMSKADTDEFAALLDAAMNNRCCAREMVAAMLDSFGAKYRSHNPTVVVLGALALSTLNAMGLPDDPQLLGIAYKAGSGGKRTKTSLAASLAESEVLSLLGPNSGARNGDDPWFARIAAAGRHLAELIGTITGDPDASSVAKAFLARIAGLVVRAKQRRQSGAASASETSRMLTEKGCPDSLVIMCELVGCRMGEALSLTICPRIDGMAAINPWFFGIRRARNSTEMVQDANTIAAA